MQSKHYRGGTSGVSDSAYASALDSRSFPLPGMMGSPELPFMHLYKERSTSERAQILHALAQLRSNNLQAGVESEITEADVDAVVKSITV